MTPGIYLQNKENQNIKMKTKILLQEKNLLTSDNNYI